MLYITTSYRLLIKTIGCGKEKPFEELKDVHFCGDFHRFRSRYQFQNTNTNGDDLPEMVCPQFYGM